MCMLVFTLQSLPISSFTFYLFKKCIEFSLGVMYVNGYRSRHVMAHLNSHNKVKAAFMEKERELSCATLSLQQPQEQNPKCFESVLLYPELRVPQYSWGLKIIRQLLLFYKEHTHNTHTISLIKQVSGIKPRILALLRK